MLAGVGREQRSVGTTTMVTTISPPSVARPPVAKGFPHCPRGPVRHLACPEVCLPCFLAAHGRRDRPAGPRCEVCGQVLRQGAGGSCENDWCERADRWFGTVRSIALHSGPVRETLARYKFGGETAWAEIFGRVLLGYLDAWRPGFERFDLIVPVPSYTGRGARRGWDHIARITEVAGRLAQGRWPLGGPSPVVKTGETPAMAGQGLPRRRGCGEGALRLLLQVPDPPAVAGRTILVVDDVFTEGTTLREVARALRLAGAVEVCGLTLARQPWR